MGQVVGLVATHGQLDRINSHAVTKNVAAQLLLSAAQAQGVDDFLRSALREVQRAAGCDHVSLVRASGGRWQSVAQAGQDCRPPQVLLAEVLDEETARVQRPWAAAPLAHRPASTELIALRSQHLEAIPLSALVEAVAALVGLALSVVRERQHRAGQIERLEVILQIAGHWNQTRTTEELLTEMAQASTRLLNAERAIIFLWDRRSRTLVGRPALGVDDQELRIADDQGIVGQVIQTGEPRRVDGDSPQDQHEIGRAVDQRLGYRARSLLCVPLRDRRGQLLGAFELINKRQGNFTDEDQAGLVELAKHAAMALENSRQHEQLVARRKQIVDQAAQDVQLLGSSPTIQRLRSSIERIANTELTVLILGEHGTGKEVASRMIHYQSGRRDEPFIAVNCAALTESLLESELFGHEKGAFTDAHEARAGKFELANGGTLFLDEIGDLSPGGQAKLLRALEEKIVVRVGGSIPITTDARVIAATNQDLAALVRENRFREDLFFRLNVVTLEIPPLRRRGDDIVLLADHFLQQFSTQARRPPPQLSAAARKRLLEYPWPGNVRELRNLMERVVYLCPSDTVGADELALTLTPEKMASSLSMDYPLAEATRQFQIDYIRRHIESARGNMTDAARRLGLHRSNLYRKMHQLGMETDTLQ
jgi:Nif-specific regulatory protein